jgi:16S rRNA C967 or C1407 C5-methylase (RsmB/RsmF family)/NOL1/NOP2/fmu family ribosome biogenesis protein
LHDCKNKKKNVPPLLPQTFIDSLTYLPGFDKEAFINVHEASNQITSIRLNPLKPSAAMNDLPVEKSVPWCGTGRYLSTRPSFTLDPVFHGGAYYVQEASSMFLDYMVKEIYKTESGPERVLDLCAAPGGKSTLLAAALPDSFIVSNEVIKTRVGILAENISKWGSDHVIVTNNDPKDFKKIPGYFDLMVVDAPCSGSGLFRKDPQAINEWSEASVEMCSHRQQRILSDTIGSLKQNGFLIYSTCSYSMQEDEDICDWITEQFNLQPIRIQMDTSWGIVETISKKHGAAGYRFYPDKVQGEGFFIACFKQTNAVDNFYGYHNKTSIAPKQIQSIVEPFLKNGADYLLSDQKEIVIASLKKWEEEIATVSKILNVRKSGVAVGTVKGKDLIPHHELALSHLLSADIPFVTMQKEEALKYLRRQDLVFENEKKGWTLARYGDINLGWMKVLPNRVNNYYPTNWRILKA